MVHAACLDHFLDQFQAKNKRNKSPLKVGYNAAPAGSEAGCCLWTCKLQARVETHSQNSTFILSELLNLQQCFCAASSAQTLSM